MRLLVCFCLAAVEGVPESARHDPAFGYLRVCCMVARTCSSFRSKNLVIACPVPGVDDSLCFRIGNVPGGFCSSISIVGMHLQSSPEKLNVRTCIVNRVHLHHCLCDSTLWHARQAKRPSSDQPIKHIHSCRTTSKTSNADCAESRSAQALHERRLA